MRIRLAGKKEVSKPTSTKAKARPSHSKFTQPLRDHFGISYFTYHNIDDTGKYTDLVDRPDWAEHYVSEKIFLSDPYLRQPKVYNPTCAPTSRFNNAELR